jgi:hypothetical protein
MNRFITALLTICIALFAAAMLGKWVASNALADVLRALHG